MYIPYLSWLVSQDNHTAELVALGAFSVEFTTLVVLLALPGTPGQNRFGAPPRG